jgi:hypothetical protein
MESSPVDNAISAAIRTALEPFKKEIIRLKNDVALFKELAKRPRTVQEEIDAIPGRRLFYTLMGTQTFDATNDGLIGQPINMLVSQDGPFIMTHYPVFMWKPNLPSTATNFGRWRPVASWPLPDQVLDDDIIDISYQFQDSGSQRNFQNLAVLAGLISRPDNMIPLPVPTLFTPNTVIACQPTYENIFFSSSGTATTGGLLVCALPGYRIVNM